MGAAPCTASLVLGRSAARSSSKKGVLAGSSACEHAACADGNMKELNEFCLQVERQKKVCAGVLYKRGPQCVRHWSPTNKFRR